jgi:23S rRNA (cytosine1962-C5)-methyltransferase
MHLKTEELVDVIRGASRHLDKSAQVVFIGGQGPDHPVILRFLKPRI